MRPVSTSPGAPLAAVNGTQVAIGASPFVPNAHFVVVEVLHIRVTTKEPQQLVYDGAEVQLFGRQQWESVVQMETHLIAKGADGACAGTVMFGHTSIEHMLQ